MTIGYKVWGEIFKQFGDLICDAANNAVDNFPVPANAHSHINKQDGGR